MEIEQLQQRLEETNRERERLQNKNMKLIREIAQIEREKTIQAQEMRTKAEREITVFENKKEKEIEYLKRDQDRTENLVSANDINLLNIQRQLDNARRNAKK